MKKDGRLQSVRFFIVGRSYMKNKKKGRFYKNKTNKKKVDKLKEKVRVKASTINADVMRGKIAGTGKSYAFFVPDAGGGDVFIPGSRLFGAIDGDIVDVKMISRNKDAGEGEVVSIIRSPNSRFVGTIVGKTVEPDRKGLPRGINISGGLSGAKTGDKVFARMVRDRNGISCRIIEKLGLAGNTDVEVLSVVRSYGIEENFAPSVLREVDRLTDEITSEMREGREDFCDDTVITIDGSRSKDFDDAVCVKRLPGGGYRLFVHIADVSEYVTSGSKTDKAAFDRGTSVYFSDRVIPMLPEKLCNDVCSLVEGKERLTLSCIIDYSADGDVKASRVTKGIIKSSARTSYDEIYDIMRSDGKLTDRGENIKEMIKIATELYEILEKNRIKNGSIEFDFVESEIFVDESGNVTNVVAEERNSAHKLIEEFMLAANAAVARTFERLKLPFVYRVHATPPSEKIESLNEVLKTLGMSLPDSPAPDQVSKMLSEVDERFKTMVNMVTLRAMSKAEYKSTNDGHYGLNFADYCHFTSPIRRYPDLAVHRIIKSYIDGGKQAVAKYSDWVKEVAERSSEKERIAEEAERKVDDVLKAKFMENKIGEVFDAKISGVTEWGVFAQLANGVEGCVRTENLPGGVYAFDAAKYALTCGKRSYRLGDDITVRVEDVSLNRINFTVFEKNLNE